MSAQAEAARSLIRVGRYGDAIKVLLVALASSPEDHELHGLMAQAYLGLEQPKEALRAADTAVRHAPDDEWAHRLRSIALRRLGRPRESVDAAMQAVSLAPELAYARHALAEAQLSAKHADDAYVQALEAVRLSPADSDMHDLVGRCLLARRMHPEAEATFRNALRLDPNDAAAHNNLGVALSRQGRREEAVAAFNDAARIDPSFETARRNLYSGTRFLIGGGSAVFFLYLLVRLAVVLNSSHRSPWVFAVAAAAFALAAVVWILRYRPFTKKKIPESAVAYYKAEKKRQSRLNRPVVLLRLASFPVAGAMIGLAFVLDSGLVLLLTVPVTVAWYWFSPTLWRRYARRIA
jgi:tetratricopeptide (TPR) repeat protein